MICDSSQLLANVRNPILKILVLAKLFLLLDFGRVFLALFGIALKLVGVLLIRNLGQIILFRGNGGLRLLHGRCLVIGRSALSTPEKRGGYGKVQQHGYWLNGWE